MSYYNAFLPVLFSGQAGDSGDTIIEDFEGTPLTSLLTWTKDGSTVTVTSTTSHVTEGTKTWRFQGTPSSGSSNFPGIKTVSPVDLSAYDNLLIDVFAATIPAGVNFEFFIQDSVTFTGTGYDVASPSGSFTANIDLNFAAGMGINLASVYIAFDCYENTSTGAVDYYTDNLRAS